MKKSKIIFAIGFSCLLAIPAAIHMPKTAEVKAADEPISLTSLIVSVHDNNLADVTSNPLYDVGLRHGHLNAGGLPGCVPFDAKDNGDDYVYSTTANTSKAIWGGQRLDKGSADGFIIKIKAKQDMKITTSASSVEGGDWGNGNTVIYFVSSNYNETPAANNWIGNDKIKKTLTIDSATVQDYGSELTLKAGETFYWEYGSYENGNGNFHIKNRGLSVKIEKVLAVDNLPMSTMVTNFTNNSGSPVKSSIVSYSIAHGNPNDGFNPFTTIASNKLGADGDNCVVENWRGRSVVNDGFAFVFSANMYSKFTVSRELAGNDWVSDAYIYVSINGEEVLNKTITSQDASEFDFETDVKKDDVVLWAFAFEWGEAGNLDSGRNIAMAGGGDIVQTMPHFTFSEIDHPSHTFDKEVVADKYLASGATCTEPASYYKSCACGEKGSETFTSGDPLGHAWGEEFEHDGTHHWHECTREGCDAISEKVAHTFDKEIVSEDYLATPATCTEAAKYYKSCVCGEAGSETFSDGDPLGHDWGEDFEHDATHHWHECTRLGCDACTEKEEHSFSTFVEHKTLPTCTDDGIDTYKCKCGLTSEVSVSKLGHAWGEDFEHDATHHWHECTRLGCDACTEKVAHTFDKEIVDDDYLASEATCTEPAKYFKSCVCGEAGSETFSDGNPLGHDWSENFKHDATHHWHECKRVGCDAISEKVEHDFDTFVEHKTLPTCTEKGFDTYECECGLTKDVEVQALGHDWGEDFEHDATHHWHECTRLGCDACTEKEEHSFSTFVEHKILPTCTEKGFDTYECECGLTKDVEVQALGHHGVKVSGQPATCTADGFKDYFKCEGCEGFFEDQACTKSISDLAAWKAGAGKINKLGHTYKFVEEVKATKEHDGVKAHYECESCDDLFIKNEAGEYIKTTMNDLLIKYQGGGCGGSIVAGSAVLCGLALAGVALIVARRKKED